MIRPYGASCIPGCSQIVYLAVPIVVGAAATASIAAFTLKKGAPPILAILSSPYTRSTRATLPIPKYPDKALDPCTN